MTTRLYIFTTIFISALLMAGCATQSPVTIKSESTANINPDNKGKPLSIVLRIYQMKSKDKFNELTFDEFMSGKQASELLGDSLVVSNEIVLLPNSSTSINDIVQTNTRYIGVIGFFRKPDGNYWRALLDADAVRRKGLTLKVDECYLQATNIEALPIPGQPKEFKPDCAGGSALSTQPKSQATHTQATRAHTNKFSKHVQKVQQKLTQKVEEKVQSKVQEKVEESIARSSFSL